VQQSPEALDQIIAPIALYPGAPEFHRTQSLQGHYSLHELPYSIGACPTAQASLEPVYTMRSPAQAVMCVFDPNMIAAVGHALTQACSTPTATRSEHNLHLCDL
jgi:hypothetical protein